MIRTFAAALATTTCIVALATPAAAQTRQYNIPAGSLKSALDAYVRQSGRQIVYRADQVRSTQSPGTRGQHSAEAALAAILAGTGFTTRTDGSLIAIVREGNAQSDNPALTPTYESNEDSTVDIVVTAQKRVERLQDVPVPVTALPGVKLVDDNQLSIRDYYSRVPGLNLTTTDYGPPVLSIRGLITGNAINPTTGIVVDDVPFANHAAAFTAQSPDIDPGDLERVEVLRGPQGTLYGASSMGGLIKFVTRDPSTSEVSGRIQAGLSSVRNGNRAGFNIRGGVNLPVSDTVAISASGYVRRDPGYIDNALTGQRGVNELNATGGRFSLLWKPSSSFSLKINALHQHSETDGSSGVVVAPGLGEFEQRNIRNAEAGMKELTVLSATATADLGAVNIVSVTGLAYNRGTQRYDFSRNAFLSGIAQSNFGVPGISFGNDSKGHNFSQELRLSGSLGSFADLLVGGFYNRERGTTSVSTYLAQDPLTGRVAGTILTLGTNPPNTFEEYAGFANLTFHLSDRFDVQLGGRQSYSEQSFGNLIVGLPTVLFPAGRTSPYQRAAVTSKDNAFTYLVTPRFRITPNTIVYARFASGYRPGTPNVTNADNPNIPVQAQPDKVYSYEIGTKGTVFDRLLSFDVSAYYIDWRNIQLVIVGTAQQGFLGYTGNGGRARSKGIEASFELRPTNSLTIAAWGAWNDAELAENTPAGTTIFGLKGDALPFSSRYSGNLSIDQRLDLSSKLTASLGGNLSYVGKRQGSFGSTFSPLRQTYPSYAKADLYLRFNYEKWSANVFVNNVTDRRANTYGGLQTFDTSVFSFIQPRTVGFSIAKTF